AVNNGPYTWSFTVGPFNSCSSVSLGAAPATSSLVGTPVTFTASASGCPNPSPVYRFWVLAPGSTGYQLLQDYSTTPTYAWSTGGLTPGSYRFVVWARDANSTGAFGNGLGRWDVVAALTYRLTSCTSVGVSPAPASPQNVGGSVVFTATAAGCPSPLYRFWLLSPGGSAYTMVQDYSASATFNWNTTGLVPGTYHLSVWARDANSAGASGNASGRWDTYNGSTAYTLTSCTSVSVSTAPGTSAAHGTTVTVTANAAGCSSPQYRFYLLAPGGASYVMVGDYSSTAIFTWT